MDGGRKIYPGGNKANLKQILMNCKLNINEWKMENATDMVRRISQ